MSLTQRETIILRNLRSLQAFQRIVIEGNLNDTDNNSILKISKNRRIPSAPNQKLSPQTAFPSFSKESISKTDIENAIFDLHFPESTVMTLAENVGKIAHRGAHNAVRARMKGLNANEAIERTRGIRNLRRDSQLSMFETEKPVTTIALADSTGEKSNSLCDQLIKLTKIPIEYKEEVAVEIPVRFGRHGKIGTIKSRCDAIVTSELGTAIIDYKTGQKLNDDRTFFNLCFFALQWAAWNSSPKKKLRWGEKSAVCKSPLSLSVLPISNETMTALIWPDEVITSQRMKITVSELQMFQNDLQDWMGYLFSK